MVTMLVMVLRWRERWEVGGDGWRGILFGVGGVCVGDKNPISCVPYGVPLQLVQGRVTTRYAYTKS